MRPTRETFLAAVLACEGVPYLWGGRSPRGLDCSGLVAWALYVVGGPDIRRSHWTDRLWQELPGVVEPQAGDLAFYGRPGDPSHVVVCLGGPHDQVIGANGGNSDVVTVEIADERRARVRRREAPNYRRDLLGFRSTAPWWRDQEKQAWKRCTHPK